MPSKHQMTSYKITNKYSKVSIIFLLCQKRINNGYQIFIRDSKDIEALYGKRKKNEEKEKKLIITNTSYDIVR